MTVFKCKMCGGTLNVKGDETVCTCDYCGTVQTLPRLDNEKKIRLFTRANDYRLRNEFDKAYNTYETIINDDPKESEAYWGLVLSEYGVEYVEDPKTKKRVPTCHRTIYDSVLANANYKKALEYAEGENKIIYEDEAEVLDGLQKRIISISSREEPYDIFICYKETDEYGNRTEDSVLAEDIYNSLSNDGYRVFFSRITLEDKLGIDYEPYIFAALKSAKVMLLVTTSNEYCNSVWVKNEWSRYLGFQQKDNEKVLIPVCKNMTAYELPDELSKLQIQDMTKLGAMQDLLRGVKKILGGGTQIAGNSKEVEELLKDKQQREIKAAKTKKRNTIILAVVALLIVIIAAVTVLPSIIYRQKSTTVRTGVPDSNTYNTFTVNINTTNYSEYFEFDALLPNKRNNTYYTVSKIEQDGWYYYEGNADITFTDGINTYTYDIYPLSIKLIDTPKVKSVSGNITFVHESIIKEYTVTDTKIKIVLKNGDAKYLSKVGF